MKVGLFTLIFLILFTLKVAGVTTLSWVWVFFIPIVGSVLFWAAFVGVMFLIAILIHRE